MAYPEQSREATKMIDTETITYALLGGILPALVWLIFWLREDYQHPEPRSLILKTFLFGMLAVILVIPFQKLIESFFPTLTVTTFLLWAILEEIFKFGAAFLGGLKSVEDNEPIDPLVYMITAALGFVAIENTLFLIEPLLGEEVANSAFVVTGNLRFIGASLLHIVSSGIVGVALAFSFYQPISKRISYTALGIILAIIFHTSFNVTIVYLEGLGIMTAFAVVWLGATLLLLAFERAKMIAR